MSGILDWLIDVREEVLVAEAGDDVELRLV